MEEIFNKVRLFVPEKDNDLPVFSYSKLDVFKKCPMKYKYKYVEGLRDDSSTLALELGTLCHYVLEQKGRMLKSSSSGVDYTQLNLILEEGFIPSIIESNGVEKAKSVQPILGLNQLKKKYFNDYYTPDKFNVTYDTKMQLFKDIVKKEMQDNTEWMPLDFEVPFDIVYDERIHIMGYIDRIDINQDGDYRTIDYKTSKSTYLDKDTVTSMQFGIYAMAIYAMFKRVPIESMYRFILIDKQQLALTKGWEKRLDKSLTGLLDNIDEGHKTNCWLSSPCPLCYWCEYSGTNPNATIYKGHCLDCSEWTPTTGFKKKDIKIEVTGLAAKHHINF